MKKKDVQVQLSNGLEARPIAMLVQLASAYDSSIHMEKDGRKINAKSIMGMMSLSLDTGETITVTADGGDEDKALTDIEKFLCGA